MILICISLVISEAESTFGYSVVNFFLINLHLSFQPCWAFLAAPSLLRRLLSSCREQGLRSSCGVRAPPGGSFSCRGALGSRVLGLSSCSSRGFGAETPKYLGLTGWAALRRAGSSPTREQTHLSCTGRQTPHHGKALQWSFGSCFWPFLLCSSVCFYWFVEVVYRLWMSIFSQL